MPVTLFAARLLVAEVQRERKMGRGMIADRAAAKDRYRAEVEEGAANTFPALAPRYIAGVTPRLLGLDCPPAASPRSSGTAYATACATGRYALAAVERLL